jgi:hypothetical protein
MYISICYRRPWHSRTQEKPLLLFPWKYVQDALTLCTRTSLLAAQESDFFLYLNPDPLRNLQHSYKQINKKPKLRRNSEYTKQSQGIQGRVIYMMQLFFFVGKSKA